MSAATRWLVVILVSTAAAVGAAAAASGTPLTTVPLLWFLAVCPGMPYARLVAPAREDDPMRRWVTAIGLSVAFAAVVAEILLYSDAYTGFRTVSVLGGIAVVGALTASLVDRARARRTAAPADARAVAVAD